MTAVVKLDRSGVETASVVEVELIDYAGSDLSIVRAARLLAADDQDEDFEDLAVYQLIREVFRSREWQYFEHASLTFRLTAPLLTYRELQRLPVAGLSLCDSSVDHDLVECPTFSLPDDLSDSAVDVLRGAYEDVWSAYQELLGLEVAPDTAAVILPSGLYADAYLTCTPRSLLNLLALFGPLSSAVESVWLADLRQLLENHFKELFPAVHDVWVEYGCVPL